VAASEHAWSAPAATITVSFLKSRLLAGSDDEVRTAIFGVGGFGFSRIQELFFAEADRGNA
jgi:hypothetical protein